MKFPRYARIFRGQLDASPFVGVLFLVAIFLLLNSSLVFTPGIAIKLPEASDLPGVAGPTVTVAVDRNGQFYYRSQITAAGELETGLRRAVHETGEPLTLIILADKSVPYETLMRVSMLARDSGIKNVLLPAGQPAFTPKSKSPR